MPVTHTNRANNSLLTQRLNRLIDDIVRVRDGRPCPGQTESSLLRWEDDEYIYLEIDTPSFTELTADISVSAGRVVIRVMR